MNNIIKEMAMFYRRAPRFILDTLKPVPGLTTFTKCSIVPSDRLCTCDNPGKHSPGS